MIQTTQVVQSLRTAKQVLFVIHEYLPLPLALWVPAVVSALKEQGKEVAVLISKESSGWLQHIDQFYPTDMLLELEQLRQEITIPFQGESFGDLSYSVEDGKLKLSVVPDGNPLDTENLSTSMRGNSFDYVVAVGITGKHEIFSVLQNAKSSISQANFLFLGSAIQLASAQQQLPGVKSIEVIDGVAHDMLEQVVIGLVDVASASNLLREQTALFFHSQSQLHHKEQYITQQAHEFLAKLFQKNIDLNKLSSVFAHDEVEVAQTMQVLLASQQLSKEGKVMVAGLRNQSGRVLESIRALYYLPKYENLTAIALIVSENEYQHHIFVSASKGLVKQVAIKYALPFTDLVTGGYITDVNFDKIAQDLSRLLGAEEIIPQQAAEVIQVQTPVAPVVEEYAVPQTSQNVIIESEEEIPLPPIAAQKAQAPSLDEVLARTTMPAPVTEEEMQSVAVDEEVPLPPKQYTPASIPAVSPPVPGLDSQKLGLDFATIAKKMRESIKA